MQLTFENIPAKVKEAALRLWPFYLTVKRAMAPDSATLWFNADASDDELPNTPLYTDCYKTQERMEKAGFNAAYVDEKLSEAANWVFVKRAFPAWKVFKPVTQAMNLAPAPWNEPLGGFGTSPLFSLLTSGLLGGGLGYAGGALAEQLLPEEYVERGKLRKLTAALGALAGAAGPAWIGSSTQRNWDSPAERKAREDDLMAAVMYKTKIPDVNRSSWNAWIEPNVLFGGHRQKGVIGDAYKNVKMGSDESAEDMIKKSFNEYNDTGIMHIPNIPVDAFNRTILADPFSSMPIQTAAIGVTEAANQAKGNIGIISPFDIARIGIGMGAGLSQAYLGGKVLGALAGLTPKAQQTLQQTGMFAGALKAVVPGLFGQ